MKTKAILFFAIFGLVGCEVIERENSLPITLEEELNQVLVMPMNQPKGTLNKTIVYIGDSDQVDISREMLYPEIGNITLIILRDKNQDTVGIGLNYFSGDNLETSHFFNYENGKPIWQSTKEYEYLSGNRIDKIFHSSINMERSLQAQYRYNSQNLLSQIEYPFENGVELMIYEYDSLGNIIREWKSAAGQEEFKIDYLVYRYHDSLLVAKESGVRGTISESRQDAFQYFYDENGRIVENKAFDPYFGFQQISRTEYFYY
ncbi:hypothetical protein PBT90_01440 [Algoriphagus halophytocola]|uniref:YD repeat-containing protein n=1 Tax=Algoriphagus halophytocola TaxID=2991499 RepID=A0ABY6MI72_9BACT|nr:MULTISPECIES: hypothetical protein [unclassified Algoriphagus]UZD22117.1 hypothetical protein OM944_15765 [Algoriphagus sp. TR-M5]WBL43368.1 hypothetical protein PBT90_01440 [Algoriphagus sp. TR-M9]